MSHFCVAWNNCSNGTNASSFSPSKSLPSSTSAETASYFTMGYLIPLAIIMFMMLVVALLGNSVVCYIVYQKPAMRSAINLLLATLALADVLTAILCMPFTLITIITQKWIFGKEFCQVNGILHAFLVTEATFILLTISIDRYLIIVRRRDTLTPQKAKLYIGLSWAIAFTVAIPPLFGWGKYGFKPGQVQCSLYFPSPSLNELSYGLVFFSGTCVVPLLLMSYCYFCILKTVRRNSSRVQNHPPPPGSVMVTKMHRPGRMNIDYSFKTRAFTTILILFIIFITTSMPYTVTRFILLFCGYTKFSFPSSAITIWIFYLNSTLNPVIYYWRISKFREACIDMMPSWCQLPSCIPGRTIRRIRPHAIYEVEQKIQVSAI